MGLLLFAVKNSWSIRHGILCAAKTYETDIFFACISSCRHFAWLVDRRFVGTRYAPWTQFLRLKSKKNFTLTIFHFLWFWFELLEIRWASMVFWFTQLLRALRDVRILFRFRVSAGFEAKHLFEEIHYANANCKWSHCNLCSGYHLRIYKYLSLFERVWVCVFVSYFRFNSLYRSSIWPYRWWWASVIIQNRCWPSAFRKI